MTNLGALEVVRELVAVLVEGLAQSDDQHTDRLLRSGLADWIGVEQFEGIAELLGKAWLEARPESELARAFLIDQLVALGKADEATEIERGALPVRVGEQVAKEALRMAENIQRSGRAIGAPIQAKK